jgi:hypothetical protein
MKLAHHDKIEEAMALIPSQAGVATVNPMGPHLVNRRRLIGLEKYPSPLNLEHLAQADYVLLDLVDCRLYHSQDPRGDYAQIVQEIVDTQEFGVQYRSGRIVLLARSAPTGPDLAEVRADVGRLVEEKRPCWP